MNCDLEPIAATDYRCRVCGREYRGITKLPLRVHCRSAAWKEMPSLTKRTVRYTKAVACWIAAGKPTRTQEQIDALLQVCHKCQFYNAKHKACSKCGCNVNSQAEGLSNKLAMATEQCPKGYWT